MRFPSSAISRSGSPWALLPPCSPSTDGNSSRWPPRSRARDDLRKLTNPTELPLPACSEVVPSPEAQMPPGTTLVLRCGRLLLYSLPVADLFCSQTKRLKHVVTVNAEIFTYAHQNREMERILAGTLNTIDGRVLQWLCGALYP